MTDEPTRPYRVEWADRSDGPMHEVAETLGTTTDLIMAVTQPPRSTDLMVMWTPGYPEDETLWSAYLVRDADGILREQMRRPEPGLWEKIKAKLDAELGPPEGEA